MWSWRHFEISLAYRLPQLVFAAQTASMLQQIAVPPPSQTVTSHMVTTPAITGAHSLMKLSSSGRMSRGVSRHPGPSRNLSALTTIKRAHRSGGYTFCGRPSKVACWLSNLCEQEPGLPISDSQPWALRSESDPYSPVGLAGLQQLGS